MTYLTTGEAARILGVGVNTVKRWIGNGALRGLCTPGGHWRIANDDLYTFMRDQGMSTIEPAGELDKRRMKRGRVLVVDDDESICALYQAILESAELGLDIKCAHDGYTGLMRIGSWHPDILLLDILMPKLNGLEVIQRIREDRSLDNMAIVVVTATFDEASVERAVRAQGVTALLSKPVEARRLLDVVGACMPWSVAEQA